jgi:murein L,D-transpeptidase YcbB/YkuD
VLLLGALSPFGTFAGLEADVAVQIRHTLASLAEADNPKLLGRLVAVPLLNRFYADRGFQPAWPLQRWPEIRAVLQSSSTDGLFPDDYHVDALQQAGDDGSLSDMPAARQAALDLLLSSGLIRLVYHLEFGKVDPTSLNADWRPQRVIDDQAPLDVMKALAASPDIAATVDEHRPRHVFYRQMRQALAKYTAILQAGGWKPVDDGPALRPGDSAARVRQLRDRLAASGDLTASGASEEFDAELEAAVRRFQKHHGLTGDGIVGADTLKALNTPVEARVAQIRVNLERARWVLHELDSRYVVVDIAGFEVVDVQEDGTVWRTRAQVGRPYRSTPVFRSKIDHLVLNPTWTVPPTILRDDMLPARRKDPEYFKVRNIRVLDNSMNIIDESKVDWSRYPGQPFPYILRQDPGAENALGRIKFMFPNAHAVYLHDTPSRGLFEREQRAFSSGCIRIEAPYRLAESLLADPVNWSQAQIVAAVDSRQTQTVRLKNPVPVLLMYWTADTNQDGNIRFKPDIYQRDQAVLEALNAPFRLHGRHLNTAQREK